MKLRKIPYRELNSRQQEIRNFQKVASVLADYGFNCMRLSDDWQGADFLAYHKDGANTLKVQLKGRVYVAEKYQNKNLFMAFPIGEVWHLIEHDRLLELVAEHTVWLKSKAWRDTKAYGSGSVNKRLKQALRQYALT